MDSINFLNSSIILQQGDSTEHSKRRNVTQTGELQSPALFVIGSMEMVNQKLAHIECGLETQDLINDCWEGEKSVDRLMLPKRPQEKNKCIEESDTKDFWTFTPTFQSSLTKNNFQRKLKAEKKLIPRLVELYQCPGFSEDGPLPFPHGIKLSTIISNVVLGHENTGGKICSSKVVRHILSSTSAKDLLLDCYLWIFLHMYKTDIEYQRKLFDRVAKSYVHLLNLCLNSHNGEAFLNVYPSLLSQAIYSGFCCSFPQSLYQFQSDDFKTVLCNLIWQWIAGIYPSPGIYSKWDYGSLEPKVELAHGKEKQKKGFTYNKGGKKQMRKSFKRLPSRKICPAKEAPSVCSGPDFEKKLFNLNGHSPLIQYHLRNLKAEPRDGLSILVRRTEFQKHNSLLVHPHL
ncbi:protein FAM227A [Pelobates fuscus]|uniref:protein FAM227A n=1 Tax=Pelobates fuscus TaxID=191477 RepID=UPI002FE4CC97